MPRRAAQLAWLEQLAADQLYAGDTVAAVFSGLVDELGQSHGDALASAARWEWLPAPPAPAPEAGDAGEAHGSNAALVVRLLLAARAKHDAVRRNRTLVRRHPKCASRRLHTRSWPLLLLFFDAGWRAAVAEGCC